MQDLDKIISKMESQNRELSEIARKLDYESEKEACLVIRYNKKGEMR